MKEEFSRTALLLGEKGIEKLASCRVAVFGVGGVGGFAVEALARSGVGALDLIDSDTVAPSNINRQIIALHDTVGKYKVDVAAERVKRANASPPFPAMLPNTFFPAPGMLVTASVADSAGRAFHPAKPSRKSPFARCPGMQR